MNKIRRHKAKIIAGLTFIVFIISISVIDFTPEKIDIAWDEVSLVYSVDSSLYGRIWITERDTPVYDTLGGVIDTIDKGTVVYAYEDTKEKVDGTYLLRVYYDTDTYGFIYRTDVDYYSSNSAAYKNKDITDVYYENERDLRATATVVVKDSPSPDGNIVGIISEDEIINAIGIANGYYFIINTDEVEFIDGNGEYIGKSEQDGYELYMQELANECLVENGFEAIEVEEDDTEYYVLCSYFEEAFEVKIEYYKGMSETELRYAELSRQLIQEYIDELDSKILEMFNYTGVEIYTVSGDLGTMTATSSDGSQYQTDIVGSTYYDTYEIKIMQKWEEYATYHEVGHMIDLLIGKTMGKTCTNYTYSMSDEYKYWYEFSNGEANFSETFENYDASQLEHGKWYQEAYAELFERYMFETDTFKEVYQSYWNQAIKFKINEIYSEYYNYDLAS